jgi:regulator of protease activity HflC (stomatin/prohibitin superfamily)
MVFVRLAFLLGMFFICQTAAAQVYRWVDEKGTVHYSNTAPPEGVKATVVDIEAKSGEPSPESRDCYTVRCQGERIEQRLARREEAEAQYAAQRAATAPRPPRGLEFRRYISIQRGMTEGELLGIAGEPDLLVDQGLAITAPATVQTGRNTRGAARNAMSLRSYTYLPTPGDPFTTTITLVGGRVSEIERIRKF